jgi:hypothetical protein
LCRDGRIDQLFLTESLHDSDSAVLGHLHCAGFLVVDRPCPRVADTDDLSVNHGGVVVVAALTLFCHRLSLLISQPPASGSAFLRSSGGSLRSSSCCSDSTRQRCNGSLTTNWPPSWIALPRTRSQSGSLATSTFG